MPGASPLIADGRPCYRGAMHPISSDRPLVIIGAGGHGRVVLDAAIASGMAVRGFVADPPPPFTNDADYLGGLSLLSGDFLGDHDFIVAIGDQKVRRETCEQIRNDGGRLAIVIHPRAWISPSATIGGGTAIMGGVIVNANASVGDFCILNTGCSVDHDSVLEDGVQLCPGVRLAGRVHCGADAFVGTGASIIPDIRVGAAAVVGAGAVVVRHVQAGAGVRGNPAREQAR
ncbi:MAG: hexapeptide transferase family protein [Alphaproteobacteria bacterium]|nr:hexapeptide transferase family protein [Alphaproteobacteria bacterium]